MTRANRVGAVLLLIGSLLLSSQVCAHVYVEATQTIVSTREIVPGTQLKGYPVSLEAGSKLTVRIEVNGGLNSAIQIWLVDLASFERLKYKQQFQSWPAGSGRIVNGAHYTFIAPTTNVYYVVLDNRANLFNRNVVVRIEKSGTTPTPQSQQTGQIYNARYQGLKTMFKFPDFDVYVKSCGTENASSNPNITMCWELLDYYQQAGLSKADLFTFFHEAAHSLLNLWRYPGYDNEDTADEFATCLLILLHKEDSALEAAQWFASMDSNANIAAMPFLNDRHSLSEQRARNVIHWLNSRNDLLARWMRIMIPNMSDPMLRSLASAASRFRDGNNESRAITQLMNDELIRRNRVGN